jgi:rhamnosyltransferase
MKYLAGFTCYYPTLVHYYNILECSTRFDMVLVYDNSETNNDIVENIKKINNVIYLSDKKNRGLSIAYNRMIIEARKYSADFLCLLDQDSMFKKQEIEKMIYAIEKFHLDSFSNVGIFAPQIVFNNQDKYNNFCESTLIYKIKSRICRDENNSWREELWVINAGTFINLNSNRNLYDENYFIDRIDADYCMMIKRNGLKIYVYKGAILSQCLGEFNGKAHTNHSVIRHYYMFRDRFYFNNKYYKGYIKILRNVIQMVRHIFLILIYEEKKIIKLKIAVKACKDYKHGVKGKGEIN